MNTKKLKFALGMTMIGTLLTFGGIGCKRNEPMTPTTNTSTMTTTAPATTTTTPSP